MKKLPKPHPDLILCIREASKAAHRYRDAAERAYNRRDFLNASHDKEKKEEWYRLKDRGIVSAHRLGLLTYVGASPQGMAIYEYGEGGMACFHSTLHPAGADRKPVEGHPEVLMVAAKEKQRGISMLRVEVTLKVLSDDLQGYERSSKPVRPRLIYCYNCGEPGHIAAECDGDDPWDDFHRCSAVTPTTKEEAA